MPFANVSLTRSKEGAPLVATFHPLTMPPTNASPLRSVGAANVDAFHPFPMPPTNSALVGIRGAPLVAALLRLHLRSMRDTNPTLFGIVGAPIADALLHLRSVRDAHPTLFGIVGAPLAAAPTFHFRLIDEYFLKEEELCAKVLTVDEEGRGLSIKTSRSSGA